MPLIYMWTAYLLDKVKVMALRNIDYGLHSQGHHCVVSDYHFALTHGLDWWHCSIVLWVIVGSAFQVATIFKFSVITGRIERWASFCYHVLSVYEAAASNSFWPYLCLWWGVRVWGLGNRCSVRASFGKIHKHRPTKNNPMSMNLTLCH